MSNEQQSNKVGTVASWLAQKVHIVRPAFHRNFFIGVAGGCVDRFVW